MITKMLKTYCVVRKSDRNRLLDGLRDLGVVHLAPVSPEKAVCSERTLNSIDRLKRALQIVGNVEGSGEPPGITGSEAAEEVIRIDREASQLRNRLTGLHRSLERLSLWGETTVSQLEELKEAGAEPAFYLVPSGETDGIEAECVEFLGMQPGGRALVGVVSRGEAPKVPEDAEVVPLPKTDRPSIRKEASGVDAQLREHNRRLSELSLLKKKMEDEKFQLEEKAQYSIALGGALSGDDLFAVQGWVPAGRAGKLSKGLENAGVEAAVQSYEPSEEENPPTLITYPGWAKPIKGLFDILGTFPGYREVDLSSFFMLALPLFSAILIGDAGYGLVFIGASLALYRKAVAAGAKEKVQLLLTVGLVTFAWGVLSGSFFGVGPLGFIKAGQVAGKGWETVGRAFNSTCLIGKVEVAKIEEALAYEQPEARLSELDKLSEAAKQDLLYGLIKVSFIIAVIHLIAGRLREALALAPDQRALASVGWAAVLLGMFRVIWFLFFGMQAEETAFPVWAAVVVLAGLSVAVLFTMPRKNPFLRVVLGFFASLLPAMGTFSDSLSYIRLMAVSLASVYIAQVFNMLGSQLSSVATWIAGVPVLILGHSLNMGLCMVAIFAHGVRLNMLEFSNHAGVEWSGYPFKPFAKTEMKEI